MDDSGVLHSNERCCIYGGIVFTNKLDQENFGRKYKSILNKIKCKYCRSDISKCKHKCPEIKDTNIKPQHKRWIWNLIKKETCFAVIIDNKRVNTSIMNDKDSPTQSIESAYNFNFNQSLFLVDYSGIGSIE